MLILSRVCAEFRDRSGAVIHRVTPETRLTFREAPEAIREDPLFQKVVMLLLMPIQAVMRASPGG